MKKWFRSRKSRSARADPGPNGSSYGRQPQKASGPPGWAPQQHFSNITPPLADYISKLPPDLLARVFQSVCPHACDETYESCEESAVEDACMLCDQRDLAHCVQVSKRWRSVAVTVLYHSIRIDSVHYCALEDILAEKRVRKSFMNRNAEPEDTAQVRLQLLCRTLRTDPSRRLGRYVKFLKVPYMTREMCKADLARTVAVVPNLLYIDLPEGLYMDDPSCHTLQQEVQARCPDLRKITYMRGAEKSIELLATGSIWRNLEVVELARLNVDPTILRQVLGSLRQLRALKIRDMEAFGNHLFEANEYLPPFPAVRELLLDNTPNITAAGLANYLSDPFSQNTLTTLSLKMTGVHPSTLQQVLATAPCLTNLSISETITTSFPASNTTQALVSTSLRTLHYEITASASAHTYSNIASSYYGYLISSLISNGLPSLRALYVLDPDFLETLLDLSAPIAPAFAMDPDAPNPFRNSTASTRSNPLGTHNPFAQRASAYLQQPSRGLTQELEVYSKGLAELEWNFARVEPPSAPGRRGSASTPRPLSSYGLGDSMGKAWGTGAGARKSVIVGNGFGGFLAIPADEVARPGSSAGEKGHRKRGSQYDIWR